MKKKLFGIMTIVLVLCISLFPAVSIASQGSEILSYGDRGEDVKELQLELEAKGFFHYTATGYFGSLTKAAVKEFQNSKGLKVDGIVGPNTKAALFTDTSASPVVQEATLKYTIGDKGDEVLKIQQKLKDLGHFDYYKVTGYYGSITKAAVVSFQKANGLVADGIVGQKTYDKLFLETQSVSITLRLSDESNSVLDLQNRLKELGYYTYYKVTGYYGSITAAAVKDFQKAHGLVADGIAGKNTTSILYSDNAKSVLDSVKTNDADIDLLARVVYGESRGEPYEGKTAVAAVVLNRIESPLFPNSMYDVVYQPNAFSIVKDGQINYTPDAEALRAAKDAINGSDPSNGALFFYNPDKTNNEYLNSRTMTAYIGAHKFCE